MFLYGQYALLLAVYNAFIWCVEEVPWPIHQSHGLWWDKKYRINWRSSRGTSRTRSRYCPRFYSRSRKRGSRVCKKTAQFTATRKRENRNTVTDSRNVPPKSVFAGFFALPTLVSDVGKWRHARKRWPLACTSTSHSTSTEDPEDLQDFEPSCLPCTTEYDSDSTWVGIDSLSTYCITNDINDYAESPSAIRREVRGIQKDPALITYVGKGRFRITEEEGAVVELPIDRLYYCSTAPVKIISPQHLDKMFKINSSKDYFRASIDSNGCTIKWALQGKEHYKQLKINNKTGVPVCKTAPGFNNVLKYIKSNVTIMDDENKMIINMSAYNKQDNMEPPLIQQYDIDVQDVKKEPVSILFHDEQAKVVVDQDDSTMDPTSLNAISAL